MTTNALEIQSDSSTLATVDQQVGVAQVNAQNETDTAGLQNGAAVQAVQAVQAVIAAADPQAEGLNFGAFNAKVFPTASNFEDIYDGGGNTAISFYKFKGPRPSGGWLPLGDIAVVRKGNLPPGVMFFAPGSDPTAFAHPKDFHKILDDGGSGHRSDVVYWRPIPPDGYVAVGICFTNVDAPKTDDYWCVHAHYVQQVSSTTAWNDSGSRWRANGNLLVPTFTASTPEVVPEGSILILPPTFLSLQDADAGHELPYALVGTGKVVVGPLTAVPSDAGIVPVRTR